MSEHVVLITGALAGIGRATATAFARDGASVVVSGRRDEEGKALAVELRGWVARPSTSNNAGYTGSTGPLATQTEEAYDTVFNTNVRGLLFSLKHELRVMIEQRHGSIVNLSSTFGERGGRNAGLYVASKHAVNGFTRSAALDVAAEGIRVNAVAPGPVATAGLDAFAGGADATAALAAGVPMGRLGHVDEIADVIGFLTSDRARFITGQIIAVNGGKTAL
jgi:NAD(P)-dependent dehydrogenase (short-subunit alcohol dehydrogenase family)